MTRRLPILCLGCLSLAVGYAVATHGANPSPDWNVSLFILGLGAIVLWSSKSSVHSSSSPLEHAALWSACLFPAYVAFQLVPLPLPLVEILSPTRVEIANALAGVISNPSFAPLTISSPSTWLYLPRIAGYVLVLLLARKAAAASQSCRRPWAAAVPLIVIAAIESVWGLVQHLTSAEPAHGTYFSRDHFAGLLEMVLPFALMYGIAVLYRGPEGRVFRTWSLVKAVGLVTVALLAFAAIAFSLSKLGFISILAGLFVIGVLALWPKLSGRKRWAAIAGIAILILMTFVFVPPDEFVKQFGQLASDATGEGRLPIWKDALHLIASYPLFGCGLNNFYPGLMKYQTSGVEFAWIQAHNDYLQMLSELGVLGFLIPATLMAAVFLLAARAAASSRTREVRLLGLACAGGLAAILIHSFGDFNLEIPANAMILWWISGLATCLPARSDNHEPKRAIAPPSVLRYVPLLLGCFAVFSAGAWLAFVYLGNGDPHVEHLFCRFGVCDTGSALAGLRRLHGSDQVATIPPAELVRYLRRDPAGPYRWEQVGESLQRANRSAEARYCFARAVALSPNIPSTLIRAASFWFSLGQNRQALALTSRALEGEPSSSSDVFYMYQRTRISTDEVLRYGLPDRLAGQAYLRKLLSDQNASAAASAWKWLLGKGWADDKLAIEYVDALMQAHKYDAAAQAWRDYSGHRGGYPESNRVFNGDFESDPVACVFDWKIDPRPGAAIDFDRAAPHSGSRSLRIQFNGTQNVREIGIEQTVFLKPGRYRFRAYVRTKEVSTDEGVSFKVVFDEKPNQLSFTTDPLRGSNDWTLVERAFAAPPGGALIKVIVIRELSLRFDNLLRGTVWIDQVSITPEPAKR